MVDLDRNSVIIIIIVIQYFIVIITKNIGYYCQKKCLINHFKLNLVKVDIHMAHKLALKNYLEVISISCFYFSFIRFNIKIKVDNLIYLSCCSINSVVYNFLAPEPNLMFLHINRIHLQFTNVHQKNFDPCAKFNIYIY